MAEREPTVEPERHGLAAGEGPGDPRVYFAAERTLLAWVRTGLAVIGLGFVVSRFGLFLEMLRRDPSPSANPVSIWIGVGLVILGSMSIGLGGWQHARFCRELGPEGRPQPNLAAWTVVFAGLLAVIGAALAVHLLVRSGAR